MAFEGWYLTLGTYICELNEGCQLGKHDTGLIIKRSSLNRSGVETQSCVWDPGFTTQDGEAINTMTIRLTVMNPKGFYLQKNARVAQLIVIENEDSALYGGEGSQWQGGRTKSSLLMETLSN